MLYYIESGQFNPWKNLAVEAVIADRIRPGDLSLYLWQNDRTVVIGRGQNALRECRGDLLEKEGGFLARRTTGGGAVYHDLGNLCFTFAASPEMYDLPRQMKVIMAACASFGIVTQLSGRNDIITEDGYKFSGNAFSVQKNCKIQHGTLMVDVNREALQRYLTPSELKLRAKGIKSVRSRVCNLKQLAEGITIPGLKTALKKAFEEEYGQAQQVSVEDLDLELLEEKEALFSSWDWRYGRSPSCELEFEHMFPWGEVQVHLHLEHMLIRDCQVFSDCLEEAFPQQLSRSLLGERFEQSEDLSAFWEKCDRVHRLLV